MLRTMSIVIHIMKIFDLISEWFGIAVKERERDIVCERK